MTQHTVHPPKRLGQLRRLAEEAPTSAPWVECGVFEGGTAELLYGIAQRRGTKLHLFDTFNGQPTFESTVDPHRFGSHRPDLDEYGARHIMPEAEVHVGIFPEILDYCDELLLRVAFVHIDFACYAGTYEAGRIFSERLIDGGMLVFTGFEDNDAVKAAVDALGFTLSHGGVYKRRADLRVATPEALPGNVFARGKIEKRKLTPRRQRDPNVAA